MIRGYVYIGALVAVAASLTLAGRSLYNAGWNAHLAQSRMVADAIAKAEQALVKEAAEAISQMKVQHVTIKQKTERELVSNTVYRECVAADRVFQLTNEAITGKSEEHSSDSRMPEDATVD